MYYWIFIEVGKERHSTNIECFRFDSLWMSISALIFHSWHLDWMRGGQTKGAKMIMVLIIAMVYKYKQ